MKLDNLDRRIINILSGDLPTTKDPYGVLAKRLDMPKANLIKRIETYKKGGVLRRFGATLYHREAGFPANAMVVWNVEERSVEEVGRQMAEFPQVSHCYERPRFDGWNYNLFTMVHASSPEECFKIAQEISKKTGERDYKLLFSKQEFKKTSVTYFSDAE